MSERQQRKLDHVRLAAEQPERGPEPGRAAGWAEVHLVHQSLPELALSQVDLSTEIGGIRLSSAIIINAMTGGAGGVTDINRDLAILAAELDLAMAVGSQTAGLKEPETAHSYRVVREVNPGGIVLANLSADAAPETARAAVEMVGANLLQIHLNAPQELAMREGDRDFRGQLRRIEALVRHSPVPVLVKECGFGLSGPAARQLYEVGVRTVDVSGYGGTNFAWIEAERAGEELDPGLLRWGIPTPCAVAEVAALGLPDLVVIASGGIERGSEAAKALALGARAVAVAGPVLRRLRSGGVESAKGYLTRLADELAAVMLLTGAATIPALNTRPVVVTGQTGEWLRLRGLNLEALARRNPVA